MTNHRDTENTERTEEILTEIDNLVRSSLTSLVDEVFGSSWTGCQERELVSLFAFGPLLQHCRADSFLHDPTQIGIEVAVPQVSTQLNLRGEGSSAKGQVCKDLVIWPNPRMTCWDISGRPTTHPACILEWKYNDDDVSEYDVDWLLEFSRDKEDFVGYAVCLDRRSRGRFRLSCTRTYLGIAEPRWLFIE